MREDLIHVAVRRYLRHNNWQLIAGQFPNGSDDELPSLNVLDPIVARDNSPAPRHHSLDKIVPDIVAYSQGILLLAEHKPHYSFSDEQKIENLLEYRQDHLITALHSLVNSGRATIPVPIESLIFVPCLGFASDSRFNVNPNFCYFKVEDLDTVEFIGNNVIPTL